MILCGRLLSSIRHAAILRIAHDHPITHHVVRRGPQARAKTEPDVMAPLCPESASIRSTPEPAICTTSYGGSSRRPLTFRERQGPEVMDASGQIPIAAYDGARVRPNGATHRAAGHWPYASDGRHQTPDQMRPTARCAAVTACHAWRGLNPVQTAAPAWYRRLSAPECLQLPDMLDIALPALERRRL